MKTITITISIQEEKVQTIKGSIMEQINIATANQTLAKKLINQRANELFKIRETIMNQLNETIGADAWFVREREEKSYYPSLRRNHKSYRDTSHCGNCFAVSIGFRDGVYKNTPYNDWDLYIQTPLKEKVVYGNIEYSEPILDVVEMYLVRTNHNQNNKFDYAFKIEDLAEVHKHLEKDYITYFCQNK